MLLRNRNIVFIICLFLISLVGIAVHIQLSGSPTQRQDIYYIWLEGKRILEGENPYARVLLGNMRDNQKYATYFPLFYWLAALTQFLGVREYSSWISLWRNIFLIFNIGIAGLICYQLHKYKMLIVGLFGALFWLFNRWTLYVTLVAHIDFLAIFFLIASLVTLPRQKYLSYLCFSVSLALKQIAIFLIPIYLIFTWHSSNNKVKDIAIALLIILSFPIVTALPFIFWNAEGFFKSILFSATRNPSSHIVAAPSLDVLIGPQLPNFVGLKAKLPMLLIMGFVYLSACKRQIGIYTSSLLTMFTFINFNSVLFLQYFTWIIPLIPLSTCDFMPARLQQKH